MVKYRVKDKVPHIKVDGKVLGPGDVFDQPEEFYKRNKSFVDPVYPPRKLSEAEPEKPVKEPQKEEERKPQGSGGSGGRVVRKQDKP